MPAARQVSRYSSAVDAPAVHPQPHRRLRIAGRQNLCPAHRPIGAHAGPPATPARRAASAGLRGDIGVERLAFAQIAAQNRIDQAAGARRIGDLCGLHGGIDHGVGGRARILELEQRHRQQGAHEEVEGSHRLRQHAAEDGLVAVDSPAPRRNSTSARAATARRGAPPRASCRAASSVTPSRRMRATRMAASERVPAAIARPRRLTAGRRIGARQALRPENRRRTRACGRRAAGARCAACRDRRPPRCPRRRAQHRAGRRRRRRGLRRTVGLVRGRSAFGLPDAQLHIVMRVSATGEGLKARTLRRMIFAASSSSRSAPRPCLILPHRWRRRGLGVLARLAAGHGIHRFAIKPPPSAASRSCKSSRRCRRPYRRCRAGEHRTGVETRVHAHDGDAGTASPARIARWMGAAPRQRGSSEACMLKQPSRGTPVPPAGRIEP